MQIKDKSINKQQPDTATCHSNLTQQPDTATYCDQLLSTRVLQQIHLPGQHHQSPRTIGKSQVGICKSTAALEILSIPPTDQTQNLPEQCPLCALLRLRVLVHDTKDQTQNLPEQCPLCAPLRLRVLVHDTKDQTQNLPEQCPLCAPLRLRVLVHDTKDQTQNLPEQCPLCAPLRLRVLVHDTKDQTQNLPEQCPLCAPLRLRVLVHDTKDQTQNLPEQCPLCAPLRLRVLAHDTTRHQYTFQLPQYLLKEDTESVLARDHLQHQTPPSNKTTTHLQQPASKNIAKLDARRKQKKRQAENKVATNNGRRTEGCWVNMGHSSKESPRQRGLKAAGLTWGTAARRAQDRGV